MAHDKPVELFAGVQIEVNVPHAFIDTGGSTGSLGCFALDEQNRPVMLSCSHVLFPGYKASADMAVFYPNYSCTGGGTRVATPDFDPKKKAIPDDGAEGGYKGGYVDGKWFGGFKDVPGDKWVAAPSVETPFTTLHNQLCSLTDCAVARLDPGVKYSNELPITGGRIPITGINTDYLSLIGPNAGVSPKPEQYLRIVSPNNKGRVVYATMLFDEVDSSSNTTVVLEPDATHPEARIVTPIFEKGITPDIAGVGGKTSIRHMILLPRPEPIDGEPDYTKHYGSAPVLGFDQGDSGSVVIDHQGRIVAMVIIRVGFNPYIMLKRKKDQERIEFQRADFVGICTPIETVFAHLKLHLPDGQVLSGIVPGTAPEEGRLIVPGFSPDPVLAARLASISVIRDQLRTSRRGRVILAKINRHRYELQHLLAANRAVNATWRSLGGPAFYHHCLTAITKPTHVIPNVINGVSRRRLATALLPLLAAHGSRALRRDIDRYGRWLLAAIDGVERIEDVPVIVAGRVH
ncbi:hypothetical protein [Mesorhizobium sp. CO1-1-8]|uniref:hypothetical protein n=1 Tax=Mesorhizobium sp. CO1-1-8 TaxID=2876631 RepID=UPI001CD1947E|nr:hypothetical protein [Mesorhizobium sp. CO1-1-8]MBZ9772623.1 hypothetical protein [Mesorhizobium sp. CO1-1-8]